MDLFDSVLIRSAAVPFLATGLFAGAIRWIAGGGTGRPLAGAAVGVVFLWMLAVRLGVPDFPPGPGGDSILYVMLAGLLAGIALDAAGGMSGRAAAASQTAAMILFGLGLAYWLAPGISAVSIAAAAVWAVAVLRLRRRNLAPAVATGMLTTAGTGMIVLMWIGGLAAERELAIALTAALAGFLIWSWPPLSYPAGATLLLAGTGGIFALALRLADAWPASIAAFAVFVFLFFADSAAATVIKRPLLLSRGVFPLTVAALGAIPIALGAVILLILTNLPAG
ncbi:MAG: hypothetical protein OXH94_15830 [Rhodospirillales bacterium]|nr:hypothetical protein [Rhodospirillales bacterium]